MSVTRRNLLKGLAASSALGATAAAAGLSVTHTTDTVATTKKITKKPNLLIVFPDEMRAQSLGFMGQDQSITPFIDRFASQSVVLRQAVSNYPLCTPFRGMLMTGQYPYRNGLQGNCHTGANGNFGGKDFGIELKKEAITWSDILKKQGLSMGYIGKWHLDAPEAPFVPGYNNPIEGRYWNDWTPPEKRHGFDFWYSYGTYDLHLNPIYWSNDTPRDKPLKINQWSPEHEADMAIKYLRNEGGKYRNNNEPFALVVSMNPPHSPYDQVPQKYLDRFKNQTSRTLNKRPNVVWDKTYQEGYGPEYFKEYMAMINGVDEQFGRILAELERLKLDKDTLVVFFSDHGCCMGSNGQPTKNVHYEEAMRIPMMFRWPGKLPACQDDLLFSAPDIYPTLLGLMGLGEHIPDNVEGTDFSKTLMGHGGDKRPTSQFYTFMPYGGQSYGRRGVRTDRYTLVIDRKIGKPLTYILHDNKNDPYQMKNIASDNMPLVNKLITEELIPWLEHSGDVWRPTEVSAKAVNAYI
ncbi:TPA_asm: sulfatase-like hydrolase/transferase [Salmonella enterica subsp. diarizonae]|uniref:Sulfatase-like hydrolase/transferase n=1 Tax=Salmonella diarizonae TaxID=59204 RepID=A0A6X8JER5_SALDZ|nr:sulfatase [Salmonella enterica subsp. diarizonae]HAB1978956.1 sulfatase-like hydrolase/transferase [Salmonella enterica subsp. diarizonae]HAB4584565.1 sulfatase-like hydrolase/transferase [Salmonella enterica subsp. diarizonae]HAB5409232.1 sulfatase-like hydrolase/transferase [Salmonella enterica subsp. diarizonae]